MRIDPAAWAAIAPFLDQALGMEPGERNSWLNALEVTHAELVRELRELLAERDVLSELDFLSLTLPPAHLADNHQQERIAVNTVVGPYRLLQEIGHGGMSSVWLAERCDGQLNRQVALKLPFAGPQRAQMAERFRRERDILAALTHPNIARLYDAGVDTTGQSYLAMEYVRGIPLTLYCDAARLTVRERLTLFLQVLAAVELAHTHLILHRDLKPSNIQVTEQGRVVLLDFGIAKLLCAERSIDSPPTELAARMLTPDYASPEHISGSALWTTSDVYSLGVVLYELLAGVRPFGAQLESRWELETAILTCDPQHPSQLVVPETVAAVRQVTPRKLRQMLRGDLDTIILKALKKAPAERYQSTDAFARDIVCYLSDLPVSARPDSAWYRLRRFVSRNKWQVAAALVTSISIIAGAGATSWQAQKVAQQRDRALELASRNRAINDFTSMLIGEAASSEKPVTVKQMLARSEDLAMAGTVGSNDVRAAVLETIATLYIAAGDSDKSIQVLERAQALAANARDAQLKSRLTCLHAMMIADVGRIDAAVMAIDRELPRLQDDPETAAFCLNDRANVSMRAGDANGTLRHALDALERLRVSGINSPADEADVLGTIGYGYRLSGNTALANRYYEQALQKYVEAGRERSPNAIVMLTHWALVSANSGVPKQALALYDRILGVIMTHDPEASPPPQLIFNRARVLESIGRFAQARSGYESALQLARQTGNVSAEGLALAALADMAERFGDRRAAEQYLHELDEKLGSSLPSYGGLMARRTMIQGWLDVASGKLDGARAQFDAAERSVNNKLWTHDVLMSKAETDLLAGDATSAITHARAALDKVISRQGGVPYSSGTGHAWLLLGRALSAGGERASAHEALQLAVTHLSNTVDADHPALVLAHDLLAAELETKD